MAACAAVLVFAGGLGAAHAQEQGMPGMRGGGMPMGHEGMGHEGMMGQGMMGRGMMGQDMMGQGMMCRMGEHIKGRLAYLKAELEITEAQMPQWNAFADAFRADGQKMAQHCAMMTEHGGGMMAATAPERMNMMEQHMTMRLDSLRAIKAATQALYAVLSDEQKKSADEVMRGPMAMTQ